MVLQDKSGHQNQVTRIGGTISRTSVGHKRGVLLDKSLLNNSIQTEIETLKYYTYIVKPLKVIDNIFFEAILKLQDRTTQPENKMTS